VPDVGHAKEQPGGVLLRVCPPRHCHRQVFRASSFVSVGQSFKSEVLGRSRWPGPTCSPVGSLSDLKAALLPGKCAYSTHLARRAHLRHSRHTGESPDQLRRHVCVNSCKQLTLAFFFSKARLDVCC
jgi:hypothetical protein